MRRRELLGIALGLLVLGSPVLLITAASLPALFPNDLAGLDARHEPLEDRSQRRPVDGCGLTEVRAASGCVAAAPSGVDTEEVSFPPREVALGIEALNGTLHLPRGLDGPRPAVVLVHGSGPQSRDEVSNGELVKQYPALPVFEHLADALAAQGLVVLRYDKRSCGPCYPEAHRGADYTDFRFQLLLDDVGAAADYLASRSEVRSDALVVVGHSQGGAFAPHAAAADERFAAVVMLAGFAGTFRGSLVDQLGRLADLRRRQLDYLTAWTVDAQGKGYARCLDKLDGDYDPDDMCIGGGTTLRAVAEYEELNRTTLDVIGRLDVPLCAIAGALDLNVPPSDLHAIRAATDGDAEFHLIAGVGHGLRNLREPADPPELDPRVVERMLGFLASVEAP